MNNTRGYGEVWLAGEHRFSRCNTCGSIVDDGYEKIHDDWHLALENLT